MEIVENKELLKRREQEYFTLVLTKNDSNLVAACIIQMKAIRRVDWITIPVMFLLY